MTDQEALAKIGPGCKGTVRLLAAHPQRQPRTRIERKIDMTEEPEEDFPDGDPLPENCVRRNARFRREQIEDDRAAIEQRNRAVAAAKRTGLMVPDHWGNPKLLVRLGTATRKDAHD